MRLDKPKTTIIIVSILTVLCAGSFFAVRMINNSVKTEQPVTISSMDMQAAPSDTVPTETAPPLDTTQLVAPTEETMNTDLFTTFDMEELTSATEETEVPTMDYNVVTTKEFTVPSTTAPTTKITIPTTTAKPATTKASGNKDDRPTDEEAQEVIQRAAVFSNGFLGYQYNRDGNYYYTVNDPWQRNFGFNTLYDIGAPFLNFYYDTVRLKFTYKKKDWLVQLWKGQYGLVFVGAEIGLYYKDAGDSGVHYDAVSDEDALYMSMSFYRNGEERLTREYAKYWWCTGFVPGSLESFRDRSELAMRARITMKDNEMLQLFCAALEKNRFVKDKTYSVSGKDVYINWG